MGDLYEQSREKGSVFLAMKRYCGRLATMNRHNAQKQAEYAAKEEPRCLVRARTLDKKSKIATEVWNKDIVRFQLALGNILRLHLDGLKERKKTPEEKQKEKEQKRKEKAAEQKLAAKASETGKKDGAPKKKAK